MAKEIERAGLPTVQITSITPVAKMVGVNRVLIGNGIVHPTGDASLPPEQEFRLRRAIVETALRALATEVAEQVVFARPK